jgi:hypothetical protein
METTDRWLDDWRRLGESDLLRWLGLGALGGAPQGLEGAAAAYARFADDLRALGARLRDADPGEVVRLQAELEALAQEFFARAVPAWPAAPGQGPDWASALQAMALALAGIARATATAFAARLTAPDAPTTLRGAFDAWIECAEAAFQSAAHSEAFVRAEAELFNEFVRIRARQQALVEQASRSVGVPTRREVDALYDELRAVKAELAGLRAAPTPAAPRSPPRRPRKARP